MNKIKNRTLAMCLLLSLLALSSGPVVAYQARPARPASADEKPRLVVVIMIDQFRFDFLERYSDLFGAGGFRRLVDGGALFANANYDYVPTVTAAGHAAVFTGSTPSLNGIVGNYMVDRGTGRQLRIAGDTSARQLTDAGADEKTGGATSRVMVGTTIGDQMRLANNFQSKVVSICQKDYAAAMMGGKRPNGAYWFFTGTGTMASSDYYMKELPSWVKGFNSAVRPDKHFGARWDLALSPDKYERSQSKNLPVQGSVVGKQFPYVVNGGEERPGQKFYRAFEYTPFVLEYLSSFARAAIEGEMLGADSAPDLLAISFSATDLVGHYFGPHSREVQDMFIRMDRVLADFLQYLDRRVGLSNVLIAMTADHGVAPVPEYMESQGFDARRIPQDELVKTVNRALEERFGGSGWVQAFQNEQLYLSPKLMADRKADPSEVERVAGEAAMTVRGMANYFTRSQILQGRMPGGALSRRVMNGFNRERSGDVWLITKPYYFVTAYDLVTTHGSPFHYDTHVPVLFYGKAIRAGRYFAESTPADITPTLAAVLGVEPPANCVGRVLVEALGRNSAAANAK